MATDPRDEHARRCCFSDAVGGRVAGCTQAVKGTRQHRVTVHCRSREAHDTCTAWLAQVRQASRFTLGIQAAPSALPRPTARKLQCGGLLGMKALLDEYEDGRIRDVSSMLRLALARFGSFDEVPLTAVVRQVQEYGKDARD